MTISQYLENVNKRYQTGRSREHSYRGDLQNLLESLLPHLMITNEPARVECGAPDYILTNRNIPIGFIEAKDIGDDDLVGKKKHKEQFDRYKATRDPFIFTDYLRFRFYRDEELITAIRIAEIENGDIIPKPEKFDEFRDLITDFATQRGQTIRSAAKLSKMMAGKARLLSTIIKNALESDEEAGDRVSEAANTTLREQLEAFQNVLIHDIDAKEFADIYAQTIAYGMFAARLHDPSLDSFSRHEAAELIPKTNPFLRKLFQYIAGYDLDDRIAWIVDALADIFRATDVGALLDDFGAATQQNDPIIHFYETFLAEFDPALRKSRGVWYTPEPVVNFIVRAVDDILKDEFDLKDGLADTTKTTVKINTDVKDQRSSTGYKREEREVHKVQILDPAAGTGTFLAEAINQIYDKFEGQQGLWPSYVENHLIPRLNGFELLMASYAMAHLKLDMLLRETGYDREAGQRFRVYLTNSLEEHHPDTGTLFAGWLSHEANQANHVKRDTPVMVVMGNPPYSGESSNKGDWIMELMDDYKKEPGGKKKLQERNSKFINDDYVKFIKFGQHFVDKNSEGVLAFINNHAFLDNPTFRGMRWNLLKSFDKIFVLDLHGNSKKKEKTPSGGKDENVFDIRQGVSINLFVKKKNSNTNKLAEVFHYDVYGKREFKYDFLLNNSLREIDFEKLQLIEPYYYFTKKNFENYQQYKTHFKATNLFQQKSLGIQTHRDDFCIDQNQRKLHDRIKNYYDKTNTASFLRNKYDINESKSWKISTNRNSGFDSDKLKAISYRPFDNKFLYDDKEIVDRNRESVMRHMSNNNWAIILSRQCTSDWRYIFISKNVTEANLTGTAGRFGAGYHFPLYLYPEESGQQTLEGRPQQRPNLDPKIVGEIADGLGLQFVPEPQDGVHLDGGLHLDESKAKDKNSQPKGSTGADGGHLGDGHHRHRDSFAPIDLLDYIYAVLHSPSYREKYKEFLKIDFPRVPYPSDTETFWQLVALGGELRQIHLLEHPVVDDFITTYPEPGSNEISYRLTKTQPGYIPYEQVESTSKVASTSKAATSKDGGHSKSGLHQTPADHRYPGEQLGKIQINKEQYFGMVPEKAWNFYIGGYQPAEKWLKDRRDRELSVEEIRHYQKIVVALMETDRIMQQIDEIDIE